MYRSDNVPGSGLGVSTIRDLLPSSRRALLGILSTAPLMTASTAIAAPSDEARMVTAGRATVTPEQFGATGDGRTDDAAAIQRALDAAAAHPAGGVVLLQPAVAYRCAAGLVLDASKVSLWGQATLDFSGWTGRYLRVVSSSLAPRGVPANNFGYKGMISGAIRLMGAGADTASIGIDFDSPTAGTAAQLLVENMAVHDCGIGIRFGDRAYNSLFVRCELFRCSTCIDWPAAEDNGERNSFIGCILYNSGLAVRLALASATLHLDGCSVDYTQRLYDVRQGNVLALACHHESKEWSDRPIRCTGDGAQVRLDGGWVLNQAPQWQARHLVEAGAGGTVRLNGVTAHNLVLQPADPSRPTAWATGAGTVRLRDTQSLELGPLPSRLQATRTMLSDPDFRSDAWEDPVWRIADTALPIVDRHGGGRDNLRLAKTRLEGETGLLASKAYGATSGAAFVLLALPVRPDEGVLAGFRVRRDPRRPGRDGTLLVSPAWVRIDGQDANRVPVVTRTAIVGTQTLLPPRDRFVAVAPLASRSGRTAPPWATHFCMLVDLVRAHQADFIFNGLFADTI